MSVTDPVCWPLPNDAEYVAKARHEVRKTLTGWGLAHLTGDVELIVSELYTNALVHGKPAIYLMLYPLLCPPSPALAGWVCDNGPGLPQMQPPDDAEEHGRGLGIVAALAHFWGVDQQFPDGSKAVWFIVQTKDDDDALPR